MKQRGRFERRHRLPRLHGGKLALLIACLIQTALSIVCFVLLGHVRGMLVTQSAADYSDVVYVPTDNTAASNTEAIANVLVPAGVPAICGEEGICKGCGVATLSISYYDLGVTTGKMAVKILTGEADISEMPIEYFPDPVKKYNPAICEALGITVPEDYVAIG